MSLPSEVRSSATGSVTAIIPTYNRAGYLGEALASILGQTFPPTQIIVVDDGSTDATRDVVARYGPPVEYIAKPNGGKSSALNLGMRNAIGEFVWICDDDDIAAPDALAKLLHALRDNPHCGFAFGDYDLFTTDEDGGIEYTRVSLPAVEPEDLYLALMERCFIPQEGMLAKRSCYEEVGAFDEGNTRSEDLDMMLRLARRYPGVKVEGVMFHQRQHSGLRGPKEAPVAADRMIEGWIKSDRRIFDRVYATHELRDFLRKPSSAYELTDEQTITALMERACIMARKGIWAHAARDIQQICEIASRIKKTKLSGEQTNILRRIFDLFSYAPHAFQQAGDFEAALDAIRPTQLQREMRAAIIWSLPFTIGAAHLHGQKTNFYRFLRIYFQLVTPNALLRMLFNRSFFFTGLELVKNRRNQTFVAGRS